MDFRDANLGDYCNLGVNNVVTKGFSTKALLFGIPAHNRAERHREAEGLQIRS